jgi:hypothetical protein
VFKPEGRVVIRKRNGRFGIELKDFHLVGSVAGGETNRGWGKVPEHLEHVGDFLPEPKTRAFFVSFRVFEGA